MNAARWFLFVSTAAAGLSPDSLIAAAPHSGIVVRHGFTISDLALFCFAVAAIWPARRSMRARARGKAKD